MTCPACIIARENARKAGHRDWAEGVCFDHAGVDLGPLDDTLQPDLFEEIAA